METVLHSQKGDCHHHQILADFGNDQFCNRTNIKKEKMVSRPLDLISFEFVKSFHSKKKIENSSLNFNNKSKRPIELLELKMIYDHNP